MHRDDVDVLVVGAGLAGLTAALSAPGRRITVLCPELPPAEVASALAQGGIAAAVGEGDSPALHAADTLAAGAGACSTAAVDILCAEAVPAIHWLEAQGASFDRTADGRWALHREAAHGRARVLHAGGDATGAALSAALYRAARKVPTIEFRPGCVAVALERHGAAVAGVLALEMPSGRPLRLVARDTVLATGGLGQLYLHTTNPLTACGDGLAMALAAGARCDGLEFVQFHPTALACGDNPTPLITEALRGAGAVLVNAQGERFMLTVHPDAELAPRDVVAREIWRQTQRGHRIYLDARAVLGADASAFPSVRAACVKHGIDARHERIPVVPAAHYHMGGVGVDLVGRSSLERLWACGEVAHTGVHGANRLASNSLLEAVVFGRRLGAALAASGRQPHGDESSVVPVTGDAQDEGSAISLAVDGRRWVELRRLMWEHLGIARSGAGLESGHAQIVALETGVTADQVRLRGRLRLARAMFASALARHESCGAHYRTDDPGAGARSP